MKHPRLYIDQYGSPIWAKTVKELHAKSGGGRISKMYIGDGVHVGYVVGGRWFSGYVPMNQVQS